VEDVESWREGKKGKMTQLLEKAFAQASLLSPEKQDALATSS
jgi:hypothetical protein